MTKSIDGAVTVIPLVAARAELSDLCMRVAFGRERVILTRHGRPAAALVSVDDLEQLAPVAVDTTEVVVAEEIHGAWEMFTSSRHRAGWWPEFGFKPSAGSYFRYDGERDPGVVLDALPGELLSFSWPRTNHKVTVEFSRSGGDTLIAVCHPAVQDFWAKRLRSFAAYVVAAGQPGYGGGVPPNAGHRRW